MYWNLKLKEHCAQFCWITHPVVAQTCCCSLECRWHYRIIYCILIMFYTALVWGSRAPAIWVRYSDEKKAECEVSPFLSIEHTRWLIYEWQGKHLQTDSKYPSMSWIWTAKLGKSFFLIQIEQKYDRHKMSKMIKWWYICKLAIIYKSYRLL